MSPTSRGAQDLRSIHPHFSSSSSSYQTYEFHSHLFEHLIGHLKEPVWQILAPDAPGFVRQRGRDTDGMLYQFADLLQAPALQPETRATSRGSRLSFVEDSVRQSQSNILGSIERGVE